LVGYFDFNNNFDSCITIRSILVKDGHAYVQAGAGIVADSDPLFEYNECQSKAKAMMKTLAMRSKEGT
jgi:anthranilate synthase component I